MPLLQLVLDGTVIYQGVVLPGGAVPVPPSAPGTPVPPPFVPTPTPDPSGRVPLPGATSRPPPASATDLNGGDFPWPQSGKHMDVLFEMGVTQSFTTYSPGSQLQGAIAESADPGRVDTVQVRMWFSDASGNDIPNSVYEGLFINNTMSTPLFYAPEGPVQFHVLLKDKSGHLRVRLVHP